MLCASCIQAQVSPGVSPAITEKYTDAAIDSLIRTHATLAFRDAIPPQALYQKFLKDFPSARDVEWEAAGSIYEVEFEVGHTDHKAYYDEAGNLLMYGYEVRRSELPAAVRDAAKGRYPSYRFDEIKKIRKGTAVFYKIEMERRDSEVKMVIKSDGAFVDGWVG